MKSKYIYLNPENLLDFNIFLLNVYKTDFTKTFYSLIIFINKKKDKFFNLISIYIIIYIKIIYAHNNNR